MIPTTYAGNELELFEVAKNWKNYYGSYLRPHLTGRVLEVGAGIGGTTKHLCDGSQEEWICLEPDPRLAGEIQKLLDTRQLPDCCHLEGGVIQGIPTTEKFDAILYIDVIEHIEDDATELRAACARLKRGGHLIILVPAHPWLYSPFDKAIGHFRRYNQRGLRKVVPGGLTNKKLLYLDSVGLMASVANKLFLRQSYPTERQIHLWDSVLVNLSKLMDKVTLHACGKSVLGIWEKQ
ncbi:MAG: class I SAM-dependent methyltransferase [Ferruginibacter sp.]|nr:class I SAM-dependent methyltransferase [Cytophagales bacterium]